MRLPSLSGLRLGADAGAAAEAEPPAPKPELSADLIASVLAAVEGGTPEEACRTAARWCALNRAHRDACRDNADDVWRALIERVFPDEDIELELDNPDSPDNYFGEWPDWYGISSFTGHRIYDADTNDAHWNGTRSYGLHADAFDTPRAFFYALCARVRRRRMTPLWECSAKHFENVPRDYPDYFEIAKLAVIHDVRNDRNEDAHGLSRIPTDMPRYGEIARWAVQHPNQDEDRDDDEGVYSVYMYALEWVPTDRADYGELARLAVQNTRSNGAYDDDSLRFVPTDRADYDEIARLALQTNVGALQYVPTDHPNYVALARFAIGLDWNAMNAVQADGELYDELARFAIHQDVHALKYVQNKVDNYGELVRFAIEQDLAALELFFEYNDDADLPPWHDEHTLGWPGDEAYYDFAKYAIDAVGPRALEFVHMNRDDYYALAKYAIGEDVGALQFVRAKWPQDYYELAKHAIKQSPDALHLVPKTRPDYNALREVHEAEWGRFRSRRHPPWLLTAHLEEETSES